MLNKKNRGSALGIALIAMMIAVLIGLAILYSSMQGITLNTAMNLANRNYYSAESGAQLAMQMFLEEADSNVKNFDFFQTVESEHDFSESELDSIKANFKSVLEAELINAYRDAYDGMYGKFNSLDVNFNGETVTLNPDAKIGLESVDVIVKELHNVNNGVETVTYVACVYVSEYSVIIEAQAGGRSVSSCLTNNVSIKVSINGKPIIEIGEVEGDSKSNLGADWMHNFDKYNGIILDEKSFTGGNISYSDFASALGTMFATTKDIVTNAVCTDAEAYDRIGDCIVPHKSMGVSNKNTGTAVLSTIAPDIKYYVADGNLTVNGLYSEELEYIYVTGKLILQGNIYLPNLKGIYIEGKNVAVTNNIDLGKDHLNNKQTENAPIFLEIANNANITFNTAKSMLATDASEGPFTGPLVGTKIVVGSVNSNAAMTVGLNCDVKNAVFLVPNLVKISFSNTAKYFYGNSVFVTYQDNGKIVINPEQINAVSVGQKNGYAPQFYSKNSIRFHNQGNALANFYGIYAAAVSMTNTGQSSGNDIGGFFFAKQLLNMTASKSQNTGIGNSSVSNLIDIGMGGVFEMIVTGEKQELKAETTVSIGKISVREIY